MKLQGGNKNNKENNEGELTFKNNKSVFGLDNFEF